VDRQLAEAARREGFPVEGAEKYLVMLQGKAYVTTAGLDYLLDERYGKGGYVVQAHPATADETVVFQDMRGDGAGPMVFMRGEVWVDGRDRPYIDWGTTSPSTLKGFVKWADYPVEMAARRATNRAKRLAAACGLTSKDEIPDGDTSPPPQQQKQQSQAPAARRAHKPTGADDAYKGFLDRCAKAKAYLGEERYYAALGSSGYEKSNEVAPESKEAQDGVLAALRDAARRKDAEGDGTLSRTPPPPEMEAPPVTADHPDGAGALPFDDIDAGHDTQGPQADTLRGLTRQRLALAMKAAGLWNNTGVDLIADRMEQEPEASIDEAVDALDEVHARALLATLKTPTGRV